MNPLNYMRLHDYSSRNSRQHWINASNGKISHLFKPVSGSYHATPTPSGGGSDVVDDRMRDYEGPFPLDRPRWQLPNGTTFFPYQYQLVQAPMGADSSPSVGARRCDRDGRR